MTKDSVDKNSGLHSEKLHHKFKIRVWKEESWTKAVLFMLIENKWQYFM